MGNSGPSKVQTCFNQRQLFSRQNMDEVEKCVKWAFLA